MFNLDGTFGDEKGTFSVKLTKCRNCGCPNVIKTEREHNVNFDKRYYAYQQQFSCIKSNKLLKRS